MELHQLLSNLVKSWPEEQHHPVVSQAREYLELHYTPTSNTEVTDSQYEYYTEVWYSI